MMKKTIIALASALLVATSAMAQTEKRTSIYVGAGVEKEFTKYLTGGVEVQGRFCSDKNTQDFLITPSLEFQPIKYFAVGVEYRLDMSHEKDYDSEWSGRFGAYAKAKYSIGPVKLEARLKYCNYSEDYLEEGNLQYLRTKFQAAYKIKPIKLTPYISYEWFYNMTRDPMKVDKDRWTFGAKEKLTKNSTIGFEYQLYEKFNRVTKKGKDKNDINDNIFSFYYNYTFPYNKGKKSKVKDDTSSI